MGERFKNGTRETIQGACGQLDYFAGVAVRIAERYEEYAVALQEEQNGRFATYPSVMAGTIALYALSGSTRAVGVTLRMISDFGREIDKLIQ